MLRCASCLPAAGHVPVGGSSSSDHQDQTGQEGQSHQVGGGGDQQQGRNKGVQVQGDHRG